MMTNKNTILYLESLVGKIFKILPLKEEKNKTVNKYIDSLLLELNGAIKLYGIDGNKYMLTLMSNIKSMSEEEIDMKLFRSKVFESISLVKKIINQLK